MIGRWTTTLASLALVATLGLTGCAAIRRWQALAAMPPYRLTSRAASDGIEYAYADPRNCQCVYVGGPKEYAEYQRLTRERQIAQEEIWAWQNPWHWGGPWW